jgi:hypothetical protein
MKSILLTCLIFSVAFSQIPTNGLIAEYSFNGNANDISGNGHNGTVNGAVLTADRFGNANCAYSFDGTDKSITANIGIYSTLSVSLWFKTVAPTNYYPTIFDYSQSDNFMVEILGTHPTYISSGRTGRVSTMGQLELETNYVPTYGSWHHVVLIRDSIADTATLYVDGVKCASKLNTNTFGTPNGNIYIGRATSQNPGGATGSGYFTGSIDDIRLYNRKISGNEVLALFQEGLPNGLIARYDFNGNANDLSGNGHNGTVNSATLASDRFGNANSAYSFDGTDKSITANIGIFGTLSVSLWFKTVAPTNYYPTIFDYSQSDNFMVQILGTHPTYVSSGRTGRVSTMGQLELETNYVPNFGDWHHVVLIRDTTSDTATLYVDGVLCASKLNTNTLGTPNGNIFIGRATSQNPGGAVGGGYFTGSIDDVRLFNRSISIADIISLYHEGQTSISSSPIALISHVPAKNTISFAKVGNLLLVNGAFQETINNVIISIYTLTGRQITSESIFGGNSFSLTIPNLPSGIYVARATVNNSIFQNLFINP